MKKKFSGFTINEAILKSFDRYCKKNCINKSAFVEKLIRNEIKDFLVKEKVIDSRFDLTDDEKEYAHTVVQNLYEEHGRDFIEYLCMICKDYK